MNTWLKLPHGSWLNMALVERVVIGQEGQLKWDDVRGDDYIVPGTEYSVARVWFSGSEQELRLTHAHAETVRDWLEGRVEAVPEGMLIP